MRKIDVQFVPYQQRAQSSTPIEISASNSIANINSNVLSKDVSFSALEQTKLSTIRTRPPEKKQNINFEHSLPQTQQQLCDLEKLAAYARFSRVPNLRKQQPPVEVNLAYKEYKKILNQRGFKPDLHLHKQPQADSKSRYLSYFQDLANKKKIESAKADRSTPQKRPASSQHKTLVLFPQYTQSYKETTEFFIPIDMGRVWRQYCRLFENLETVRYVQEWFAKICEKLNLNDVRLNEKINAIHKWDSECALFTKYYTFAEFKERADFLWKERNYEKILEMLIRAFTISSALNERIIQSLLSDIAIQANEKFKLEIDTLDQLYLLDGKKVFQLIEVPHDTLVLVAMNSQLKDDPSQALKPAKQLDQYKTKIADILVKNGVKEKFTSDTATDRVQKEVKNRRVQLSQIKHQIRSPSEGGERLNRSFAAEVERRRFENKGFVQAYDNVILRKHKPMKAAFRSKKNSYQITYLLNETLPHRYHNALNDSFLPDIGKKFKDFPTPSISDDESPKDFPDNGRFSPQGLVFSQLSAKEKNKIYEQFDPIKEEKASSVDSQSVIQNRESTIVKTTLKQSSMTHSSELMTEPDKMLDNIEKIEDSEFEGIRIVAEKYPMLQRRKIFAIYSEFLTFANLTKQLEELRTNELFLYQPKSKQKAKGKEKLYPQDQHLQDYFAQKSDLKVAFDLLFENHEVFQGRKREVCYEILRALEVKLDVSQAITWEKFADLNTIVVLNRASKEQKNAFVGRLFNFLGGKRIEKAAIDKFLISLVDNGVGKDKVADLAELAWKNCEAAGCVDEEGYFIPRHFLDALIMKKLEVDWYMTLVYPEFETNYLDP